MNKSKVLVFFLSIVVLSPFPTNAQDTMAKKFQDAWAGIFKPRKRPIPPDIAGAPIKLPPRPSPIRVPQRSGPKILAHPVTTGSSARTVVNDLRGHQSEDIRNLLENASSNEIAIVDKWVLENAICKKIICDRTNILYLTMPTEASEFKETLSLPVQSVRVLPIIPVNSVEIAHVFGLAPDVIHHSLTEQMIKSRRQWESVPNAWFSDIKGSQLNEADQIREVIQRSDHGEMMFIFGHRDNNELRCRDGSVLNLEEFPINSPGRKAIVVVLTCDSVNTVVKGSRVVTTKRLEFDIVARAMSKLATKTRGEEMSCGQILIETNNLLNKNDDQVERFAKISVVILGGGAVVFIVTGASSPAEVNDTIEVKDRKDRKLLRDRRGKAR